MRLTNLSFSDNRSVNLTAMWIDYCYFNLLLEFMQNINMPYSYRLPVRLSELLALDVLTVGP
jgi:hypothetical protein